MEYEKTISITDNGHEFKFKLRRMSAYDAMRWGAKAGALLLATGIMNTPAQGSGFDFEAIGRALAANGWGALGQLDVDRGMALLAELIEKSAVRVDGAGAMNLNEAELKNLFVEMPSLFALGKACFLLNFGFFLDGGQSASRAPEDNGAHATAPKISIKSSPRS